MAKTYEDMLKICAHDVSFRFWSDIEITEDLALRLNHEAEERATEMIHLGYVSGELNYEDEECSFRGWCDIVKD